MDWTILSIAKVTLAKRIVFRRNEEPRDTPITVPAMFSLCFSVMSLACHCELVRSYKLQGEKTLEHEVVAAHDAAYDKRDHRLDGVSARGDLIVASENDDEVDALRQCDEEGSEVHSLIENVV